MSFARRPRRRCLHRNPTSASSQQHSSKKARRTASGSTACSFNHAWSSQTALWLPKRFLPPFCLARCTLIRRPLSSLRFMLSTASKASAVDWNSMKPKPRCFRVLPLFPSTQTQALAKHKRLGSYKIEHTLVRVRGQLDRDDVAKSTKDSIEGLVGHILAEPACRTIHSETYS